MIIFGTKDRREPRGIVAERCTHCNSVRPFEVVDHYEVGHVYFVSVGEGTRRGTSILCLNCRGQFQFTPGRYQTVLPLTALQTHSIEEIVAQTNPELMPALQRELTRATLPPPVRVPEQVFYRCATCGATRDFPYKFCPQCGTRRT